MRDNSTLNDACAEFKTLLNNRTKGHLKVQTAWVKVKSVDWDKKLMVATGVTDDLDFEDVQLGIGFCYLKPKQGTTCLIGLIENQDAATFLIEADEVEEAVYTVGDSILTITEEGFKVERNGESLTQIINDMLDASIAATYTNGAGTTSPANNVNDLIAIKQRVPNVLK